MRNYKNFFSNFKEPEYLVRLAIMLTSDTYKETLYKKYGKNLDDTTPKSNVTQNDTKKISHRYINKIKEIIEFLNTKNLTEEEITLLMKDEEKIKSLKKEYKLSRRKKFKLFEKINQSEAMIRLAITFLIYENQEFLKTISGPNYDNYLKIKTLEELELFDTKIKLRIERVLNYLSDSNVTEEQASLYLNGENTLEYIILKMNFFPDIRFYDTKDRIISKEMLDFIESNLNGNTDDILEYLTKSNITPNDIPLIMASPASLEYIKRKYETAFNVRYNKISFFSRFKEDKSLVLLATKLLKERDKEILHQKHGENLEKQYGRKLANKEEVYFYNKTIPNTRKILDYLKRNEITIARAKYLLSINGSEELELLKSAYYIDLQSKHKNNKSLFKSINKKEYLIRLSFMFLSKNYQKVLIQRYGNDLKDIKDTPKDIKTQIINAKGSLKKIIKFLESKHITEENYLYLISKEGNKDLEKLKKEYLESKSKPTSEINRHYNNFFSYFDSPKHIVRFSVYFLEEKHKDILYAKYNEDLENTILKEKTQINSTTIKNTIIPIIKDIILFLNKEGITDKHIVYLLSDNGSADLNTLIEMYKTQKSIKWRKNIIFRKSKNYSDEEKIQILLERYEGKINIGMISEILNVDKDKVSNDYLSYKLKK